MSQGRGQSSQQDNPKQPKYVGICSECWSTFKIQRATGHLHRHGHRNSPCPGSNKSPVANSTSQPPTTAYQPPNTSQPSLRITPGQDTIQANSNGNATDSSTDTTESNELSHPPWIRLIDRIPKAARISCSSLLTEIIRRIIDNPNDKGAWREMLHFGPTILAKPKRGGANRNLSNVIIKRVAAWDEKNRTTHPEQYFDRGYNKRTTDDSRLAAAITRKLEAGNFRAAIRLICSSESLCSNKSRDPASPSR